MHQYRLGTSQWESSFAGKDLEVLVDTKLSMSQQCALAAKKANSLQGYARKNIASRSREVILLLYFMLLKSHLEFWDQCWASQYKREME